MLDIKDLQSRAAQAKNALDDVQRYEQYLDKHPNIFAPITSHPILKDVVPFLEALPGIGFVPGGKGTEGGHGWDLRNAITQTELNEKVISFASMFINKVLKSEKEVDFETRLSLENAVRDLKDEEVMSEWQNFTASKTEIEAQNSVKKLLGILISKIQK
ncbi:MAG: hypothetical protein WCG28_04675 [bacterium]